MPAAKAMATSSPRRRRRRRRRRPRGGEAAMRAARRWMAVSAAAASGEAHARSGKMAAGSPLARHSARCRAAAASVLQGRGRSMGSSTRAARTAPSATSRGRCSTAGAPPRQPSAMPGGVVKSPNTMVVAAAPIAAAAVQAHGRSKIENRRPALNLGSNSLAHFGRARQKRLHARTAPAGAGDPDRTGPYMIVERRRTNGLKKAALLVLNAQICRVAPCHKQNES